MDTYFKAVIIISKIAFPVFFCQSNFNSFDLILQAKQLDPRYSYNPYLYSLLTVTAVTFLSDFSIRFFPPIFKIK